MSKSLTDQFALSKNISLIIRSKGFCGGEKERHHVQIELARSRNSSRNSSGRWKDFLIFRHNNSKWLGCVRVCQGDLSPLVFLGWTQRFSRMVSGGTFCPSLVRGEGH